MVQHLLSAAVAAAVAAAPPAAAATVAPTSATVTAAAAAQAAEPLGRAGGLGLEPGNVGGGDRAAEADVAAGHAGLVEPLSEHRCQSRERAPLCDRSLP